MNSWKVTYEMQGETRDIEVSASAIPSKEAIAFAVYSDAFPGAAAPDGASSIDEWLFVSGIVVRNITLI
ncbi:hypothetical protein TUM18999_03000 [Pseudomonas tohonis]|uniref:Uncharacterized protein n=1 Tax=Pseudomonas tohonis TaxID=2725477 RepID=A0A6J4DYG8_9PSED|nr:hypothetical protein [Pseudomonas tohonis]BCG22109.1 hypothetical protein TUM18999_03000 [Pseudomonas tohonis]